jgi:RloB-like protein
MGGRQNPLRRRAPQLEPRPHLLIICEGKVTEPSYLRGLKEAEEIRLVDVIIDDQGGTPKTLVERGVARMKAANKAAKGARDESLRYDEIWCIFDVDDHPKLMDAKQQAEAHGLKIAVSNPCFELWLLLHFKDQRAWIHRHDAQAACRDEIKEFEKRIDFKEISHRVDAAVKRATDLERWQETRGSLGENPSTTVHKLVERLKDLSKSESLRKIQNIQSRVRPL